MGLARTTIQTIPLSTTNLELETMSVDDLVNIIKEEEGLGVDENDVDLTLHLDDSALGEHNNPHFDEIKAHFINEDSNDEADFEEIKKLNPPKNEEELEDDFDDDDEDDDEDDEDDDESDENDQAQTSYPHKGQLIPPPYYPYPYYPHIPPHGYIPPPMHQPHVDYNLYTGSQNPHVYTDASTMTDPAPDTRRNRGGVTEPFPEKLHRMLDAVEREGLSDVVSFFSHGRAFAIHKPRRFVSEVMHRFFRQTRLTSFQRQLNLYGFRRISTGPDNGGYYHELFLKGRPGLCVNMKRTKVKGTSKLKRDPDTEPNFYAMRPIAAGAANSAIPGVPPVYAYPPPPYYPPPPPSYPPYTAAQNGSMPPLPPGYPPYPPHPYFHPYWFGMPPPPFPQPQKPRQQSSTEKNKTKSSNKESEKSSNKEENKISTEIKVEVKVEEKENIPDNVPVLEISEVPPSPLPEVTADV